MKKNHFYILFLSLLLICSSSPIYAAKNVTNAFSADVSKSVESYKKAYSWNDDYLIAKTWRVRVPGKGYQTFTRQYGYQDYFLADNILATRYFLGLNDGMYQPPVAIIPNDGGKLIGVANRELLAKDSKEVPDGSGLVKYNTWYGGEGYSKPWSVTFLSYCADESGYIDGKKGKFLKTGDVTTQYNHLRKQFSTHEIETTTPFGGKAYTPMIGDIIFLTDGGYEFTTVGIISSIKENGINVIAGDMDNKVSKTFYSKDDLSSLGNSVVIHIVY